MRIIKTGTLVVICAALAIAAGVRFTLRAAQEASHGTAPPAGTEVFTPAHNGIGAAIRDFFSYHSTPTQPIAFTHKVHLANGMECTNCHVNVENGAIAGIPGIKFCMTCHQAVATDKPEIKKMAAMFQRGEDISWQRVFDYSPTLHVRFNHAPHIRNQVDCAVCHGDMRQRTVAVRSVNVNMGFCVNCHKARKVSVECATCHF